MNKHEEITGKILQMIKPEEEGVYLKVDSDEEAMFCAISVRLMDHLVAHHEGDLEEAFFCLTAKMARLSSWLEEHKLGEIATAWIDKRDERYSELYEKIRKQFQKQFKGE